MIGDTASAGDRLSAPVAARFTEADRRRGVVLVTAATFFMWLSLYLYVPFLPLRALDLGASNTMVGAVIASYAIAQIALRIPIGVAADMLGRRKPFALAAIVAAAAGALWLGLSPNPMSLFFARALTGVAGAGWVALSVLYASYFSTRSTATAMARITAVNGAGIVLASLAGGWIAGTVGTTATFYAGVVSGVIGASLLLLAPEPPIERTARYSRATFMAVARTPLLLLVAAISVLLHFVTFATSFGFVPLYAEKIGASNAEIGYITTVMFAASVAGTLSAPYFARKLGYGHVILAGGLLMTVAALVVPGLDRVLDLGISQAVGGFGRGMVMALLLTLSVLAVAPAHRATAVGLYQAIYAIGMMSGAVVAGTVADGAGIEAVFYMSAGVAAASGALVFMRPMRRVGAIA